MVQYKGHLTLNVFLGYFFLILLVSATIFYSYTALNRLSSNKHSLSDKKELYLIAESLTLLYKEETDYQLLGEFSKSDYQRSNDLLSKVQSNLDTLRTLFSDNNKQMRIDTISKLLVQKQHNIRLLRYTIRKGNTKRIYDDRIKEIIRQQEKNKITDFPVKLKRPELTSGMSDVAKVPNSGPLKTVKEVFLPSREKKEKDEPSIKLTIPSDTIVQALKNLQDSVASDHQQAQMQFYSKLASLEKNDRAIANQITTLLREIEKEKLYESFNKLQKEKSIVHQIGIKLTIIAVTSILILFFFVWLVVKDVKRIRYYREKLEASNSYTQNLLKMRERLMMTISHDLRAPLSSIIGTIDILPSTSISKKTEYYLGHMKDTARHMLSLVNDLLDFHRLDSGNLMLNKVSFDVVNFFNQVKSEYSILAKEKGLKFIFEIENKSDTNLFFTDPVRLRQVINNLLSNALKFTKEGCIGLSVRILQQQDSSFRLLVDVLDTGAGIPEAKQKEIFNEFVQLESEQKSNGFGFGLSIVKKIVGLLDGKLSLESSAEKGSKFMIDIPISPKASTNNTPKTKIYEGKRLLIIDDDKLQLEINKKLLEQLGLIIDIANNANEVIESLKAKKYDLLITDIQMPEIDGYSLLTLLRKSHIKQAQSIPIVALTADTFKPQDDYIKFGFSGMLNKPLSLAKLRQIFDRILLNENQKEDRVDFSSLTEFALDDAEASKGILMSFVSESEKQLSAISIALSEKDVETVAKLSHKMIPIFKMIKQESLVKNLSQLERAKQLELSLEDWDRITKQTIEQLQEVVKQAKNK